MAKLVKQTKYVSELTEEMIKEEWVKDYSPIPCKAFPIIVNGKIIEYEIKPLNRIESIGNGAGMSVIVKNKDL